MNVEERATAYEAKAKEMFDLWKSDWSTFRKQFPEVQSTCLLGHDEDVLESIGKFLLDGTGFEYQVAAVIGANPVLWITAYRPERPNDQRI